MKTNTLSKITAQFTKRPREVFSVSNDLNTTATIGDLQPVKYKLMLPNSKMSLKLNSLVRAAPLVAPTFARLYQKFYSVFVPLTDVSMNFTHMLAQEPVRRGTTTFTPLAIPHIKKKYLSSLILIGAKVTLYCASSTDSLYDDNTLTLYSYTGSSLNPSATDLPSAAQSAWSDVTTSPRILSYSSNISAGTAFGLTGGLYYFNLKSLFPEMTGTSGQTYIPLSNVSVASFFDVSQSLYYQDKSELYDLDTVDFESADVVLPLVSAGSSQYFLAFRLSSFGKRLRKIIQGLEDGIDFQDETEVDFLKYIAYYKAYFDCFGLTLYDSYETTYAYNLQWYADQAVGNHNFNSLFDADHSNDFWQFIRDLGACFYTEEQDYVSAHIRNTAVSPTPANLVSTFTLDVDSGNSYQPNFSVGDVSPSEPVNFGTPNGHVYINDTAHGQLDSELLQKLYQWTNIHTIAGRRVEQLLRAQGLGAYADALKEKRNFIGMSERTIPVSDVTSQADTFDSTTDSGSLLGEQTGKAVEYMESESFTHETSEFGYWFTLYTIVPKAGYCEQQGGTSEVYTKWHFYHPDFDGMGYQATRKSAVHGNQVIPDLGVSAGRLSDTFGFIPRYSNWKVNNNLINGDMNRRGTRNTFAPYHLDRLIDVGERLVKGKTTITDGYLLGIEKLFMPKLLPIAGNSWRFLSKYAFMGNFERIFAQALNDYKHSAYWNMFDVNQYAIFENHDDNFVVQGIFEGKYYAPMLKIEDSFETKEDGNKGATNASLTKA